MQQQIKDTNKFYEGSIIYGNTIFESSLIDHIGRIEKIYGEIPTFAINFGHLGLIKGINIGEILPLKVSVDLLLAIGFTYRKSRLYLQGTPLCIEESDRGFLLGSVFHNKGIPVCYLDDIAKCTINSIEIYNSSTKPDLDPNFMQEYFDKILGKKINSVFF